MTQARQQLVDTSVTRWYHTISRCVRRSFLLGKGHEKRRKWLENRLEELSSIFAVSVGSYSVMENHLHVICRLDDERVEGWSDEEVVRRWAQLFPPRNKKREPIQVTDAWIGAKLKNEKWVATIRQRLGNLGWFMKCLKEPLARMANKEDGCTGAFWEGRYKSVAILDREALLATAAYVDLNPVAAGAAATPEKSDYTSLRQRADNVKRQSRTGDVAVALAGSIAASARGEGLEEELWLCPIEDRRQLGSSREGMIEGFTLGNYLLLVEETGRSLREGKSSISSELDGVFERLATSPDQWCTRIKKLAGGRHLGRFFATNRQRLRSVAQRLGCHHLANFDACPA